MPSPASTTTTPPTVPGKRFVAILLTVIALLLVFAFVGWFWTKANRSKQPQIGVPMQYPSPLGNPARPPEK